MDGWMGVWVDRWMGRWADEWMDGWTDKGMMDELGGWVNGQVNG